MLPTSVSLSVASCASFLILDGAKIHYKESEWKHVPEKVTDGIKRSPMNFSSKVGHDNSNNSSFFTPADRPPSRSLEQLEVTTFRASSCNAADLGNHVLRFLQHEANCTIRKVNRNKFSIKADLSTCDWTCSVKIRFYMEGTQTYALSSSVAVVIASPSCQFIGKLLSTSRDVSLVSLMPLRGTTTKEASCHSVCSNSCQKAAVPRHICKFGLTQTLVCPSACNDIGCVVTEVVLLGVDRPASTAPFHA